MVSNNGNDHLQSAPRQTGSVKIAGRILETVWHGPPPHIAPTLVFLHEGLGCVSLWRGFPARLAAATNCGALVYSRSGYGGSDPCDLPRPIEFMHPEALEVLPQLLTALKVRDHILIGHSDGGSIALIYAGRPTVPGLRAVVTEAAHVFCEPLSISSIQKARGQFLTGDLRLKLKKYHGPNTDCAFWGWNDAWLHPDFEKWNIERILPRIKVPVLALQGNRDPYGTWKQVEAIKQLTGGPATAIRVQDCGHCPHHEQPEMTLQVMADFVRQNLRQPKRHWS